MLDIQAYYEKFLGEHIDDFTQNVLGFFWALRQIQSSYLEAVRKYTFWRSGYGLLKVYTKSNKLIRIEI